MGGAGGPPGEKRAPRVLRRADDSMLLCQLLQFGVEPIAIYTKVAHGFAQVLLDALADDQLQQERLRIREVARRG